MKKNNPIEDKSLDFATKILRLSKSLMAQKEYIASNQIGRSGTSIGANVAEAAKAQSKADFFAKMKIADKEASETAYWLKALLGADYISKELYVELYTDLNEICSLLSAICKTTQKNIEMEKLRIKNEK